MFSASPTCSYSTSTRTLTITGVSTGSVASGWVSVNSVRNPISSTPRANYKISTCDSTGARMNTMNASYQVTQPASFSTLAITRINTTVSEKVSFYFLISLGFPVQTGAFLNITFPGTYPLILSPTQ